MNLGFVYVRHEANPEILIRADSVWTIYTRNLTLYENLEVKKERKKMAEKDRLESGEFYYEISRWKLWQKIHGMKSIHARRLRLLTEGRGTRTITEEKSIVIAPDDSHEKNIDPVSMKPDMEFVASGVIAPKQKIQPFDESIYQRVAAIDNMYVSHPMLRSAIDGLSDCVSWSAVSAEPRGALLTGIGGAGKTTVCKAILKRFPALDIVEGDSAIRTVPAFYASVPSPSTIRSLAASLLVSIGDPLSPKGSAASLTTRLAHLLKVCRTQMILLDEFHNLLAEAAAGQPHANRVCNWLRTLINETRVM
eukprot:gene31753-36394_t